MEFEDITYETRDGIARITINRPEVRNALRTQTYQELTEAFRRAAEDQEVGVIVLAYAYLFPHAIPHSIGILR